MVGFSKCLAKTGPSAAAPLPDVRRSRYKMNVQRFTQLYLLASAVFCVLLLAALVYGDRQMCEPLMLFAIILIVVLPIRRSRR